MREQRWDALIAHIHKIVQKYPIDAAVYNFTHSYPPCTTEQAGENCKEFIRLKLACLAGEEALRLLPS